MEQALSDIQHRLSAKNNELHAAHETINRLEDRLGDLESLNVAFFQKLFCLVVSLQLSIVLCIRGA